MPNYFGEKAPTRGFFPFVIYTTDSDSFANFRRFEQVNKTNNKRIPRRIRTGDLRYSRAAGQPPRHGCATSRSRLDGFYTRHGQAGPAHRGLHCFFLSHLPGVLGLIRCPDFFTFHFSYLLCFFSGFGLFLGFSFFFFHSLGWFFSWIFNIFTEHFL